MKLLTSKRLRFAAVAAAAVFACVQTFGADVPSERKNVETVVAGSAESAPENDASIAFSARSGEFLSEEWRADFATPPRAFRPLQIVQSIAVFCIMYIFVLIRTLLMVVRRSQKKISKSYWLPGTREPLLPLNLSRFT